MLFLLTFGFTGWVLQSLAAFAHIPSIKVPTKPDGRIPPHDKDDLARLSRLMDEGIYMRDGLTVAILAKEVGVPEHKLRKLIK